MAKKKVRKCNICGKPTYEEEVCNKCIVEAEKDAKLKKGKKGGIAKPQVVSLLDDEDRELLSG